MATFVKISNGLLCFKKVLTVKRHIPNLITLLNLVFGCCAIIALLSGESLLAVWLILAGAVADFLDGLVARWLGVTSAIGKELDSLADVVSFGVVPSVILYQLLSLDFTAPQLSFSAIPAFVLAASSAYRLAKFNLDERQKDAFLGLPTPACTIFVVGLLLIYLYNPLNLQWLVVHQLFLYSIIVVFSYLLLAEIPMFSFKISAFTIKGNEIKFIFAAIALGLVVLAPTLAPSAIIALYVLINLIAFALKRNIAI